MTSSLAPARTRLSDDVRKVLAALPQVSRVVLVDSDHPEFVITVQGDWVNEAPAVHRALRPLRRSEPTPFHYRTVRSEWNDPDPYLATVLLDRR